MSSNNIKIICVCGARPNFMKIAPIMRAFKESDRIDVLLVHTGQHYDKKMSELFFEQLNIPKPDVNLGIGSGSHAVQTADVMKAFEPVVLGYKPDYVLVVGDVNSTIACGLVAVKLGVKLVHVEAGLRSFDRTMPEEINRILTDSISDLLFVTEPVGLENLRNEGIPENKISFVGNVMVDTLLANREKAGKSNILNELGLNPKKYATITLHRPSNVDDMGALSRIVSAFEVIEKDMKLIFPIHPRTKKNIAGTEIEKQMDQMNNLLLIEPLGYLDFLKLVDNSILVLSDSGGIQVETTILGVACITLRNTTEVPVTLADGTNHLVEVNTKSILEAYDRIKSANYAVPSKRPYLWDGNSANRMAEYICKHHN
ncbi:UDP-2,3-diacetamido-2,3-dideoxy-D-glucuronate 2-epimerase [Limihaloglobus sulfuriphilus]|uniref:UDP-2,3-diacetamido-2,3-dideoxy-D-glucuronate 2-epimerase n=1 Tax=Limihaloglobus sulfuriphilus TaxID=1851148 RepID=A0A1Q2MFR6_9BACT|nr:UDP-N-acetylglucosamine 2-epimerase (non-hydrolyzing) [Limihaloglobus sulfuriphilus]AQQ71510.1 UDP-2,3-diacetamido-2,3-dideoxy-D-glucuronate 2-epimerase [Limihaloglobus sulfuriphilus]